MSWRAMKQETTVRLLVPGWLLLVVAAVVAHAEAGGRVARPLDEGWEFAYVGDDAAPPKAAQAWQRSERQRQPQSRARKKVLLVGIDGVRPDLLQEAETPHLDALAAAGFLCNAGMRMPTISGPGWSNILTGVWPENHGVYGNDFAGKNYDAYPDFLTRIERVRPALSTLAVADWPPLVSGAGGGPLIGDRVDAKILFNADQIGSYADADARSAQTAAHVLSVQNTDAAFVYLGNPDVVAHEVGALDPAYRQALETADAHVGQLIAAIKSRSTYTQEDWLILVSTDHGHVDGGGHGGDSPAELTVFVLASGPAARRQCPERTPQQVDLVATALTHLGLPPQPAWQLAGQATGLRPSP